MFYLLKLMVQRKRWFTLALLSMTLSALFTIIQANAIARIFSVTADMTTLQSGSFGSNNMNEGVITLLKGLYDAYIDGGNRVAVKYLMDAGSIALLLSVIGLLLLITFVFQIFSYFKDVSNEYLSTIAVTEMRRKMVLKMIDLPFSYYKKNNTSVIITKLFDDLSNTRVLMVKILEGGLYGPIIGLMGLLSLVLINYKLIFFAAFMVVVIGITINILSIFLRKVVYKVQHQMERILQKIQSIIYGIDIVKIFNRSEDEKRSFEQSNNEYQRLNRNQILLSMLNRPILEFFSYMGMSLVLLYISLLIWNKEMVFDDMVSIFMLAIFTSPYLQRFGTVFILKQQVDIYVKRMFGVLEENSEHQGVENDKQLECKGSVTFKDVSFRYDTQKVLNKISFTVEPGEMIAFVGLSGSGKTTIANLICSFLDGHEGSIYFDDFDVSQYSLAERRRHVSFVSQDNILFPMSIYENIAYAKPNATAEEVYAAAQKAHCHDFVHTFEKGYETVLVDMGKGISGGQKQRICLARAILKESKILVLDEATSALDSQSEKMIQESINKIRGDKTLIVIAHRISTIRDADKIVVLDGGEIVEMGNHETLMKQKGLYSSFVNIQKI